jgi:hypothetical protein
MKLKRERPSCVAYVHDTRKRTHDVHSETTRMSDKSDPKKISDCQGIHYGHESVDYEHELNHGWGTPQGNFTKTGRLLNSVDTSRKKIEENRG